VDVQHFVDRQDAGRRLAARLRHLRRAETVVLGLPRGGVPVALEVARALHAPLDVVMVRRLVVPFRSDLALGAIGEGDVRIVNDGVVRMIGLTSAALEKVELAERTALTRQAARFRAGRARIPLAARTAVIVDDGVATGATARAACRVARALSAARVVLAVPVAPRGWTEDLHDVADELICLETPEEFAAISGFYEHFPPVGEDEVVACLNRAVVISEVPRGGALDAEIELLAAGVPLNGRLTMPAGASGAVLFAHGSGSSHQSPRDRYVAAELNRARVGTLLFDLLTPEEEGDRNHAFDVSLLARRLRGASRWFRNQFGTGRALGYFGSGTGAAAALRAAADAGDDLTAVVSRGGRPDLADGRLGDVRAPTLLIVGGLDAKVLELNRRAEGRLRCESRLTVVPGARHLFEEPGALGAVAALAGDWFANHLTPARSEAFATP
jgi:putative phosphoribosyl transferase